MPPSVKTRSTSTKKVSVSRKPNVTRELFKNKKRNNTAPPPSLAVVVVTPPAKKTVQTPPTRTQKKRQYLVVCPNNNLEKAILVSDQRNLSTVLTNLQTSEFKISTYDTIAEAQNAMTTSPGVKTSPQNPQKMVRGVYRDS
jgi:hypothetical protein